MTAIGLAGAAIKMQAISEYAIHALNQFLSESSARPTLNPAASPRPTEATAGTRFCPRLLTAFARA